MQKKEISPTAWMLKKYMNLIHMASFKELAAETGIEYRTLISHIDNPGQFRIYEIRVLDEVLRIDAADLICLLRGGDYATSEKITYFNGHPDGGAGTNDTKQSACRRRS